MNEKDRLVLFEESISSDATKKMYMFYLRRYMEFLENKDPLFQNDAKAIEAKIIEYIISMKQEQKGYFAIKNHISSLLAFYKINDIVLNVSKIKRFLPSKKKANRDRALTKKFIPC